MEYLKLTSKNLPLISSQHANQKIEIPTYERSQLKEGIVHVGVGGFHRAHLAVYVDQLLQKHGQRNWAICGVGLRPNDAAMRDVLRSQDHMYTVIERSAAGSTAKVVGSINSFLFAPDDREAVIAKMACRDTHIVSLTITESGYYYNENTHELQSDHPDIQHDLANVTSPVSTFGFLYAALVRRYDQGLKPFTVLSCDNMQKNGTITRNMLESFARLHNNPDIAKWIAEEGAFPNSMVDRITPSTSQNDIKSLADNFGIEDGWPVVTEPFMQWVVEDKFCDGRPPFEQVGVQVVKDVHDVEQFEKHKLRLLNASHSAMAYPGQLAGFKYVHEVMQHPVYRKFIWQMMQEEAKPVLPEIPGVDIDQYCNTLMERFSNPTIMDQIPRVALNASGKIPQFVMPSIAEQIWVTGPFRRLCFVLAAWFRYINGVDDKGNSFEVDDPMRERLQALAKAGGNDPRELLSIKMLFGDDLRDDERFVNEVTTAMELIAKDGVMATLPKYVN
ncbi:hypothetical protein BGZ63DRAFT_354813 [Mariannaea sp. PMI_226]|nr:hypothetical protein BGZ63DRAFT_354813 [Mariannaea sp. PMI_226]